MANTYSTYRLGAVASLKFLAIENMPPHFSAHVYYCQTAGWIWIPLGTTVRLGGPSDIVLDGDQAPLFTQRGTAAPTFWPTALTGIPAGPHLPITRIVD